MCATTSGTVQDGSNSSRPLVADPVVVCNTGKTHHQHAKNCQGHSKNSDTATGQKQTAPPSGQTSSVGSKAIRQGLRGRGFSDQVSDIMLGARKQGTRKQYSGYIKRWYKYCGEKHISQTKASVPQILDFMEITRKERELSYNSVNVMRSALSAIIAPFRGTSFGDHPDTVTYMKGVYNLTPKVPKYQKIWDVNQVIEYLKKLSPAAKLPIKSLTLKTATLLMIVTGQRVQTLSLLDLDHCQISKNSVHFVITQNIKTSKPGQDALQLHLQKYPPDQRLCIVRYIKAYIARTKDIRQSQQLFISFRKPYAPVQKGTIAHWVKAILELAGVDTTIFQGHSVRAASCSKAARQGVPLQVIMNHGGWRSSSTFQKFYNKPLVNVKEFHTSVLG